MPFTRYREHYDPETLMVLQAAFDEAWEAITANNEGSFDEEATRSGLADLIVSFASEGVTDPKRLKAMALAALPKALA
jgi:hypothetical protein